ncbi:unnamed protein product, partial [Ectocarpus sp. 12 AP-2014]
GTTQVSELSRLDVPLPRCFFTQIGRVSVFFFDTDSPNSPTPLRQQRSPSLPAPPRPSKQRRCSLARTRVLCPPPGPSLSLGRPGRSPRYVLRSPQE